MQHARLKLIKETINNLEMLKTELEWEHCIEYQLTLTNAIQELKKLIPRAPYHQQGDPLWGYCPNCHTSLYKSMSLHSCRSCLQRLDWDSFEDIEEETD
jgi:hypothetical protein